MLLLSLLSLLVFSSKKKKKRPGVDFGLSQQVHQQEVWEQTVKKVRDPANFDWQKQARFYWKSERDTAITSIADADTEYCYEYLKHPIANP